MNDKVIKQIKYGNNKYNFNQTFLTGNIVDDNYILNDQSIYINSKAHNLFAWSYVQNHFISGLLTTEEKCYTYDFSTIKNPSIITETTNTQQISSFFSLDPNKIYYQQLSSSEYIVYFIAAQKEFTFRPIVGSSSYQSQGVSRVGYDLSDLNNPSTRMKLIQTKNNPSMIINKQGTVPMDIYRCIDISFSFIDDNRGDKACRWIALFNDNNQFDAESNINRPYYFELDYNQDFLDINGSTYNDLTTFSTPIANLCTSGENNFSSNSSNNYLLYGNNNSKIFINNCVINEINNGGMEGVPRAKLDSTEKLIYCFKINSSPQQNYQEIFSFMKQHYIDLNGNITNPKFSEEETINNIYTQINNNNNYYYYYDTDSHSWKSQEKNNIIYFTQSEIDDIFNGS